MGINLSRPFVRLEKISVELLNHEQIFIASVSISNPIDLWKLIQIMCTIIL